MQKLLGIKKAPVADKRLKKFSYRQWSNISIMEVKRER